MGYGETYVYGAGYYKGVTFDFQADKFSGVAPLTIKFTTLSNDVFNYQWHFGDGHISSERDPVHTYGMPGVYTVRLKASSASNLSETKTGYITVYDWDSSTFDVSSTNKSYRFATENHQGIGISENASDGWIKPEGRISSIQVKDNYNRYHTLISDGADSNIYETGLIDGPSGAGESVVWEDKVSGGVGTAITQTVTFKEDTGEYEKFITQHLKGRYNIRTQSNDNLNADGYDVSGFPTDLELDSYLYVDGLVNTVRATAKDITLNGEVVHDRKVEGHRLQNKLTANKGPFRITGRQQDYITKDIDWFGDGITTTEGDWQTTVSNTLIWATRGSDISEERVYSTAISGIDSYSTGPDGYANSAYTISSPMTISGITNSDPKTLLLFVSGTLSDIAIGASTGLGSVYSTNDGWKLYRNNGTIAGNIVLTPSGTAKVFDVRMVDGYLASADLDYMIDDIFNNNADNICPLF